MTKKPVTRNICDVGKCENEAAHKCANCGIDICDRAHSHSHGDHGHIEHAVRVTTISMKYLGEHEFWVCPNCFVKMGLCKMERKCGKHVEGTGGMYAGDTMG